MITGWNIRYFFTSSFELSDIFQNSDIICLSEHCLFEEQKTLLLEYSSDHDGIVVCSNDNLDFMDGRQGYGGVAILWKRMLSDFVEKLDVGCDRIVGIQLFLPNRDPLFIFSVYLPSSSHSDNQYMEYLDQLWSLCDLYLNKGPCCFVGDFNAALGKQGGPRGFGVVNARGRKLIEFLDYFNLVVINLFELTEGPLHSYMSDDERHKSMIDYIVLPASFIGKVNSCVVGKWQPDLMSDHVPITVSLNNQGLDKTVAWQPKQCGVRADRKKVSWDNYSKTDIDTKYTVPLSVELSKMETDVHIDDLYGEILRSMLDVSERHLKVKHLSTRGGGGDKNVIKFANKKKLPSHIVEVRKDLDKLSNARKLDDSESLNKDYFAKRTEYRLLM